MNVIKRADGNATTAAVAEIWLNPALINRLKLNCGGRANGFTGSIALWRAKGRIKMGLAKVGVFAVVEADHEPWQAR